MVKKDKSEKTIRLLNKSKRDYQGTSQGTFYAGTSKAFPEKEAIKLLGHASDIVRVEDGLKDPEFKKMIEEKDARIKELEAKVEELEAQLKKSKVA